MRIFDDKIPENCAEFERGADPQPFRESIEIEYKRVKELLGKVVNEEKRDKRTRQCT